MTEAELQRAVIECARLFGWRVAHFRPAKTERGWRTAVEADGAGFPDLVLARNGRLVFAELKADRGQLSVEQKLWLEALDGRSRRCVVWRPVDWTSGVVESMLR